MPLTPPRVSGIPQRTTTESKSRPLVTFVAHMEGADNGPIHESRLVVNVGIHTSLVVVPPDTVQSGLGGAPLVRGVAVDLAEPLKVTFPAVLAHGVG